MNLTGQIAEAVAALALVREGFEVSAPIFTSPAFDLVAKWGRAIHAIQVKGGTLCENGKTVQWHTCTKRGMYTEEDCSYFGLVLIPRDEVWWVPVSEVTGKKSLCTNTDKDWLFRYRGNLDSLKA
jgi:hypothetical protein